MRKHSLPTAVFDALAAGDGDAATVRTLWKAQLSKLLLRLRALWDSPGSLDPVAFDLLAGAQRRAPDAVTEILLYPQVVAWSVAGLREQRSGAADMARAHFGGIAAAAGIRAGLEFTVTVAVRKGCVMLPTLGSAEVGPSTCDGRAVVHSGPHGVEVRTGQCTVTLPRDVGADAPGWHALRRLRSECDGHVLEARLDDLDPFRESHRLGSAPRLDVLTVGQWQRILDGAWSILVRHHPERAESIATGLAAFIPLAVEGGRQGLSATSADAPGAIAITPPGDALLFAESLVHEFQHAKLCALLDLLSLHSAGTDERFYAPWRDDPRPLGGLLQGAYAYLGVTDFWGRQQEVLADGDAAFAQYAFVLWRDQTLQAIGTIKDSGRLTEAGAEFVAGMRAALERWTGTPVPPEPQAQAEDTATDHRLTWRLRHLRPDPGVVDRLAGAWPIGQPNPVTPPPRLVVSERPPGKPGVRTGLRHLRLRRPTEFRQRYAVSAAAHDEAADLALVGGNFSAAVQCYTTRLAADPNDDEAWSGLAVSARRGDVRPAGEVLCALPELVAAVHRRIVRLGAGHPNPLDLACWLEPALRDAPRSWVRSPTPD
jgi:HEXXH motif-containing protein